MIAVDERSAQHKAVERAFMFLGLMIATRGRRLERMYLQSTHHRMRVAWKRRDGTFAHACELEKRPLGPHIFEPTVVAAKDEDRAMIQTMRNVRRRDRKRGRSPTKWS